MASDWMRECAEEIEAIVKQRHVSSVDLPPLSAIIEKWHAKGCVARRVTGPMEQEAPDNKPTYAVGVSVLLTDSAGRILLGRRKNNIAAGLLSTPGGRVEQTETFEQCAAREFHEETGAELGAIKIIGFRKHFRYGQHYVMFYAHAETFTGEIRNMEPEKCEGWQFWRLENVPAGECTEPEDILVLLAAPSTEQEAPAPTAPKKFHKHTITCYTDGVVSPSTLVCGYEAEQREHTRRYKADRRKS